MEQQIVVTDMIDHSEARPELVLSQTFDLFDRLAASEWQLGGRIRRWHDPAFPRAFPWFGEMRWERHLAADGPPGAPCGR
jgi:hypothetical protein